MRIYLLIPISHAFIILCNINRPLPDIGLRCYLFMGFISIFVLGMWVYNIEQDLAKMKWDKH